MRIFDPDRTGIVAASSELLHRHGCTIVQSEHYTDRENEMFFQRILFEHSKTPRSIIDVVQPTGTHDKSPQDTVNFETQLRESEMSGEFMNLLASESGVLKGDLDWMNKPKRVAIMVSRFDHCLWELLLRHRASELSHYQNTIAANNNSDNTKVRIEIPLVISNHDNCRSIVEDTFGIPFVYMPITAENKEEQELKEIELLLQYKVDVVVLARYMQVLSPRVLDAFPNSIINIHHSFLPAFAGGKAYRQAHERGVKLIGATVSFWLLNINYLCMLRGSQVRRLCDQHTRFEFGMLSLFHKAHWCISFSKFSGSLYNIGFRRRSDY